MWRIVVLSLLVRGPFSPSLLYSVSLFVSLSPFTRACALSTLAPLSLSLSHARVRSLHSRAPLSLSLSLTRVRSLHSRAPLSLLPRPLPLSASRKLSHTHILLLICDDTCILLLAGAMEGVVCE
jgi:hypothetical protein